MDAIKEFEGSKVQYYFEDMENEKLFTLTLNDLTEGADKDEVVEVGTALNALIDFPLGHAKVTESHRIVF